ncbi:SRPBCC family protein [Streptomyces roseolus]|uniref:SRPBCC family protein n=1 Tax=Streptomyces roseolus TaxID=67358 RepID=UPI0036484DCB
MTSEPSGRLVTTERGRDLIITRELRAPIGEVWANLTESERTARWYGPWTGEAGPGRTIKVQMSFEEGEPWMEMRVEACEPPHRLLISAVEQAGSWLLEVQLVARGAVTELVFTHHLSGAYELEMLSQIGPGWEYYLDMFEAARTGADRPEFGDYYPAFAAYYDTLA